VRDGELDAIVLAAAGLGRLGAEIDLRREARSIEASPTAAGQGALAVETAADVDEELLASIAALDDAATRFAVTAERAVLAGVEAGCHAPVGVHAAIDGDTMSLRAAVYGDDPDDDLIATHTEDFSQGYIRAEGSGDGASTARGAGPERARKLGTAVAESLIAQGAAEIVSRQGV
jgi:hydroxymethylbilane synthase